MKWKERNSKEGKHKHWNEGKTGNGMKNWDWKEKQGMEGKTGNGIKNWD